MVNFSEFYELENKARAATALFIAETISQPRLAFGGAELPPDPEASLHYLLTVIAQGDPHRLHRICRLAWADHCQTGKPHWSAIWDASRQV